MPLARCHTLDRRAWLKLGGRGLGALACGAEPNLARLFAAERADRDDFSVILFWANGGPSHLDTFDLKPDAPAEVRGPFEPVATNVTGIRISEHLPRLAKCADKFALVRSLHHKLAARDERTSVRRRAAHGSGGRRDQRARRRTGRSCDGQ